MSKIFVSGCGEAKLNGTYVAEPGAKQQSGLSCPFGMEGGDGVPIRQGGQGGVIEYQSSGYHRGWYLKSAYIGGDIYYICNSTSSTPPLTGWEVNGSWATAPAPSLSLSPPAASAPAQPSAKVTELAAWLQEVCTIDEADAGAYVQALKKDGYTSVKMLATMDGAEDFPDIVPKPHRRAILKESGAAGGGGSGGGGGGGGGGSGGGGDGERKDYNWMQEQPQGGIEEVKNKCSSSPASRSGC